MTENEAKNLLDNIWDLATVEDDESGDVLEKAVDIAIKALEEIPQYRAIGTPTQIFEKIGGLDIELGKYYSIGTVEEFKALIEKNVAKKPIIRGLGQRYCPVCKCGGANHFYCTRCGQKLVN